MSVLLSAVLDEGNELGRALCTGIFQELNCLLLGHRRIQWLKDTLHRIDEVVLEYGLAEATTLIIHVAAVFPDILRRDVNIETTHRFLSHLTAVINSEDILLLEFSRSR